SLPRNRVRAALQTRRAAAPASRRGGRVRTAIRRETEFRRPAAAVLGSQPSARRAGSRRRHTRSPPAEPSAFARCGPRKSAAGKQALLDEATDDVPGGYVDLLDQRRRIRRRMKAVIAAR